MKEWHAARLVNAFPSRIHEGGSVRVMVSEAWAWIERMEARVKRERIQSARGRRSA
jgi:hypothetical protein